MEKKKKKISFHLTFPLTDVSVFILPILALKFHKSYFPIFKIHKRQSFSFTLTLFEEKIFLKIKIVWIFICRCPILHIVSVIDINRSNIKFLFVFYFIILM